jgi:hypothetical protein
MALGLFVDGPGDSRIRIFVGGLGYSRMAQDIREFDRFAYGLEHNFVQRHDSLQSKYTRKYDYQRAKCENPVII